MHQSFQHVGGFVPNVMASGSISSVAVSAAPAPGAFENPARLQLERFFQTLASFLQSCGAPGTPMLLSKVASSGPVQAEWAMLQRCSIIGKTTKMKQVILQRPQTFSIVMDNCNQPHVRLVNKQTPAVVLQAAEAIHRATSKASEVGFHDAPLHSEDGGPVTVATAVQTAPDRQFVPLGTPSAAPLPVGLVGGGSSTRQAAPYGAHMRSGLQTRSLPPGASLPMTNPLFLRPEQVSAIEAYLRKNNGQERLSKIGSQFGVKKAQVSEHFMIVPYGNDPIVALKMTSKLASGLLSGLSPVARGAAAAGSGVVQELEELLRRTVPSRHSVCDAMAFCLDNAQHAAQLARRLTASLGEKDLDTDSALARLYVVSDVLRNSNCGKPGVARYLTSLQDLLPEAFEQFGREWFRRIESHLERSRAEQRVRSVFAAWQEVTALPPLFVKGLEALFFAPVLEDANIVPSSEPDELLRRKLTRWFSVADQVRLPSACQLRGLAGKALSTAACRARLCHFERYWHRPGISTAEDEDVFGDVGTFKSTHIVSSSAAAGSEKARPDRLGTSTAADKDILGDVEASALSAARAAPSAETVAGAAASTVERAVSADQQGLVEISDPLDGEDLTDGDMAALGLLDGESLFGEDVDKEEVASRALGGCLEGSTADAEMIFALPEVVDSD